MFNSFNAIFIQSFYESITENRTTRPERTSRRIQRKAEGKAFKVNANYKKAKSAKRRFRCFVCSPLALSDSKSVRHNRPKSIHANLLITMT